MRWRLPVTKGVHLVGQDTHPVASRDTSDAGDDAADRTLAGGSGMRTVVLLHGGASNRRWWDPVARLLAPWQRVIWWDQRGHGQSDEGPRCTVDRLAADTIEVLAQLATPWHGTAEVVLVGHSAGAAVALAVAAAGRSPVPVAGVVCVEGGLFHPRDLYGTTWPDARTAMMSDRTRPVTADVLRAWLPAAGLPLEAREALLGNFVPADAGLYTLRLSAGQEEQLARSVWEQNLSTLLPAISCPILAVAADTGNPADTAVRIRSIRAARRLVPGFVFETWLPGGHDLPLQQPAGVAAALARFTAVVCGRPHRPHWSSDAPPAA